MPCHPVYIPDLDAAVKYDAPTQHNRLRLGMASNGTHPTRLPVASIPSKQRLLSLRLLGLSRLIRYELISPLSSLFLALSPLFIAVVVTLGLWKLTAKFKGGTSEAERTQTNLVESIYFAIRYFADTTEYTLHTQATTTSFMVCCG